MLKINICWWFYFGLSLYYIFIGFGLEDECFVDSECISCGEGSYCIDGKCLVVWFGGCIEIFRVVIYFEG